MARLGREYISGRNSRGRVHFQVFSNPPSSHWRSMKREEYKRMDGIGEAILRYFNFNFRFFWKCIRTRFVTRRESISVLVVFLEFEVVEKKGIILSIDRAMLAMTYFFFFLLSGGSRITDRFHGSVILSSKFQIPLPIAFFPPPSIFLPFRCTLSVFLISTCLFHSFPLHFFYPLYSSFSIFRFLCPNILSSCIFNFSLFLSLSFF